MGPLEVFYSEALRHFREVGGSDDEFKWFVGARLAWFGIYRDEVRLRLKMAEEVSRRIRGRVLDVGSGTGFPALLMAISGNAREVFGLEKDPHMVDFSKRLENHAHNLRFVEGDFLKGIPDLGKFDTIVFMYILHDFEPCPFLEGTFNFLKPGGRVVVADFDLNGLRKKVMDFAHESGLVLIEDVTVGRAYTHGRDAEAFLIVLGR